MKRIAIGTDHHGVAIKKFLCARTCIDDHDITWIDAGTNTNKRVDFPFYAAQVVAHMRNNTADLGILLCGSGIGMSIAANRHQGIYAALAWCPAIANDARRTDNANILVLPADYLSPDDALAIVHTWLITPFAGGHYLQRLAQLDQFK